MESCSSALGLFIAPTPIDTQFAVLRALKVARPSWSEVSARELTVSRGGRHKLESESGGSYQPAPISRCCRRSGHKRRSAPAQRRPDCSMSMRLSSLCLTISITGSAFLNPLTFLTRSSESLRRIFPWSTGILWTNPWKFLDESFRRIPYESLFATPYKKVFGIRVLQRILSRESLKLFLA